MNVRWWTIAALLALMACGSTDETDEEDPTRSGVDQSQPISSEGVIERLCDWSASRLGGYGSADECGGLLNSREECVDANVGTTLTTCGLTVEQWEHCVNALEGDQCLLYASVPLAVCDPFLACDGTFRDPG